MAQGDKTVLASKNYVDNGLGSKADIAYVNSEISNIDLSTKQDVLVSGTNIKTIAGNSVLGSGDLEVGGGGLKSVQVFTSSGTWTKPAGINFIKVTVVGGGGGGSISYSTSESSSGGGGGGTAIKYIDVSSVNSVSVTVGAGGTLGADGGNSSFGTYCYGNGGGKGVYSTNPDAGGAGGTATGGDINISGSSGLPSGSSAADTEINRCNGGDSLFGRGGVVPTSDIGTYFREPSGYGAGGNGSAKSTWNTYVTAGTQGIVIVEEYA